MVGYLSSCAWGPNGVGISSYPIHLTMEMEPIPKYGFYIRNWDSIQNPKEQEGFHSSDYCEMANIYYRR